MLTNIKTIYNMFNNDTLFGGFFGAMFAQMEAREKQQRNEAAGILYANGKYGVPDKNIEFMYSELNFHGGFYHGWANGCFNVFDNNGKFLFSAQKYRHLGKNIFLVFDENENITKNTILGALWKDGIKLTEKLFRNRDNSFKGEFCVLGLKDWSEECVVNTSGEIVFENKKTLEHLYLHKNIASVNRKYYNLFTGQLICEADYHSPLEIDELMFVQVDKQVFKINTLTCEVEKFGTEPEPKPEPVIKTPEPKKEKVILIKQQRNDKCNCNSGLKFKNCHGR